MRSQFTHCIDIGPTILEAVGIPEPTSVDGIDQEPMDGTSFLYTFDDADGGRAAHRAVLRDVRQPRDLPGRLVGCTKLDRLPWDFSPQTLAPFGPEADWDPDRDDGWELYYLPDDFSQAHDVAADHPEKVAGAEGALLAGGRTQPRAAAARRVVGRSSESCRRCRPRPGSRSPATSRTSSAA